ncbi:MAG: prolipoprotein diacylglyceryl transferase [Candidatus Enterosoma sp.]|nr:prolipoprotein diacylglyceryl transferase [bacterium]MDD7617018.1 prolipoprotein diacylglyceryl transferase [bacterium]MDY5257364.1 prolipoprotein diacylglyceryl transferase [Candidatus Enterosoma sp.]MDY5909668.1 prolipoprotein diacylglyceryl transferase [Candidatus Enterosoma sp.]
MLDFIKDWYVLIILLTISFVFTFLWLFLNRSKLSFRWWECLLYSFFFIIFGVCSVRFFAVMEAGFQLEKAGNLSLFGGIFFLSIYYLILSLIKHVPIRKMFDFFTIPLIVTLLLARTNCYLSGCCYGKLIGNTSFRYPTREFELLFDSLLLVFMIPWVYQEKSQGRAYPVYMIAYGLFRFLNEFMRYSETDRIFHIAHLWSIVSILIGISFLLYPYISEKKITPNEGESHAE